MSSEVPVFWHTAKIKVSMKVTKDSIFIFTPVIFPPANLTQISFFFMCKTEVNEAHIKILQLREESLKGSLL